MFTVKFIYYSYPSTLEIDYIVSIKFINLDKTVL